MDNGSFLEINSIEIFLNQKVRTILIIYLIFKKWNIIEYTGYLGETQLHSINRPEKLSSEKTKVEGNL